MNIRKRIYTIGLVLLLPLTGWMAMEGMAQGRQPRKGETKKYKTEKPDLPEIQRSTLDPKSDYYYPKLMAKYERKDTTMTPDEFRHFYLGYMFQEDFDPYRVSPYANKTDYLRSKKEHTKQEMDTIEKYANLALEDNPFDLRQMSFLVHVLKEKKKDMRAKIWEYRLENLLGTIMSTGTGKDVENPWYVIYPMHEYDVAQLLGYEAVDVEYPRDGFDYLVVQPDETDKRRRDKSAKGFYYNVIIPQEQYELKHGDEEELEEIEAKTPAGEEEDYDEIPAQ
ncbi:MAG: DUF4919 domain-containing protein [Muribaculaceae bacterium]|nr:DUF4919 domain-containing protein [Muribaculaceae bacterium]